MLRNLFRRRVLLLGIFCLALIAATMSTNQRSTSAADFSGREILSVTRIAHGGADYSNLQYVTVKASGFVNAVAFGGMGANPLGGMAEVKLTITDYQDKQMRRRLEVAPTERCRDELIWCSPVRPAAA